MCTFLLSFCLMGADMPRAMKIPNTTLAVSADVKKDDLWDKVVKYEQTRDGKVVYTVEKVRAYQTPGGAWVVHRGDIRVTMHNGGVDRITTPDGVVLRIDKFSGGSTTGSKRVLYTTPLNPQPPKPKK